MLKSKRFWIGLAITVVSLVLAFQGIQLDKLAEAFGKFDWWWLPILVLTFFASYVGRAFRWQALFDPYKPRWSQVFATLNIGYFLSNITPARLGDFVRPYLLGTIEKIPVARALSTVVVERALDGLTVVVLLLALLPFIPNVPTEWVIGGLVLGAIGMGALIGLAIISMQRERGVTFLRKLASPFKFLDRDGLWRFVGNLIDGFAVLRSPRPLLRAGVWSLSIWFGASLFAWFAMFAMDIHLPFTAGMLVQVAAALAVTVAPSPGQFGVFHAITRYTLSELYHIDPTQALAYAFVLHGITYIILMVLGISSAWREGFDLAKIQNINAQSRGDAEPPEKETDESIMHAEQTPVTYK